MMTGTRKKSLGAVVLVMAMMVTLILGSIPAFAADGTTTTTTYTLEQVPATSDGIIEFVESHQVENVADSWSTIDEATADALYASYGLSGPILIVMDATWNGSDVVFNCRGYANGNTATQDLTGISFRTLSTDPSIYTIYYPVAETTEGDGDADESEDTNPETAAATGESTQETSAAANEGQQETSAAANEGQQETSAAANGNEYTLTRTVASSDTPYTWTIPTAIDWTAVGGEGNEGLYKGSVDFKIAPTSGEAYIILENGKSLQLTVSSGNGWKLKGTNNNELAYTATKDGATTAIANGDTIFDVASGSDDASGQTVKVNFATTDAAKIADTYTDTLTFTSSIVDTPAAESAE